MKKQKIDQTLFLAEFAGELMRLGWETEYVAQACATMMYSLNILEELGKVKLVDWEE